MLKKIMKRMLWMIVVVVMVITLLFNHGRQDSLPQERLTIEQIQPLNSLVTIRVHVADVILVNQCGLTGGTQVAAIIKGDYSVGVDLSKAHFEQVDPVRRKAVLRLPPPQVSEPRVDLSRTRLFGLSSYGLWQIVPGTAGYVSVANLAYRNAQLEVANARSDPVAMAEAKVRAEHALGGFFSGLHWDVRVDVQN